MQFETEENVHRGLFLVASRAFSLEENRNVEIVQHQESFAFCHVLPVPSTVNSDSWAVWPAFPI